MPDDPMIRIATHETIMAAIADGKLETDARLKRGETHFQEIFEAITRIEEAVKPIPQMQADIRDTKEIVEAWTAVKTMGKFLKWFSGILAAAGIKWFSGILAAAGIIFASFRLAAVHLFKG